MHSLLLVGCGNMGGALMMRWAETAAHLFAPLHVVEPREVTPHGLVTRVERIAELPGDYVPRIIVLGVKPQQLDALLPQLSERFGDAPAYLSIAAGKPLAFYARHLGEAAPVIRAMPNTPAMIGEGITALVANAQVCGEARAMAETLMRAVGEVVWLDDEKHMDAVTALSGSGPAYFFYMMECLAAAGMEHGLSAAQAAKLVLATCAGSAALAEQRDAGFADLRADVTSPGGTTAAAMEVLQNDNKFQLLMKEAVAAAIARAAAL